MAAGVSLRMRLRGRVEQSMPVVDDAAVKEILTRGALITEEDSPLDIEQIDEEEQRFWSESWNEPDEW